MMTAGDFSLLHRLGFHIRKQRSNASLPKLFGRPFDRTCHDRTRNVASSEAPRPNSRKNEPCDNRDEQRDNPESDYRAVIRAAVALTVIVLHRASSSPCPPESLNRTPIL